MSVGALEGTLREQAWRMPTVSNARRSWSERRGLVLELRAANGRIGRGEASPLPGYSPESLDEVRAALEGWLENRPRECASVEEVRERLEGLPSSLPTARFAAETALLELLAGRRGVAVEDLLADRPAGGWEGQIRTAALVSVLDPGQAVSSHGDGAGELTVKVKVGRPGRFEDELRLLEALRRHFGDRLRLRLDANGAFGVDEVGERLRRLAEFSPQWIEEPVETSALLDERTFVEVPAVPLALDESLAKVPGTFVGVNKDGSSKVPGTFVGVNKVPKVPGTWERVEPRITELNLAAVVLKPGLLGGILPCLDLARRAQRHGLATVVSHLFDGPLAFEAARCLARVLDREQRHQRGGEAEAHGLAPYLDSYSDGEVEARDSRGDEP